MQMTKLLHTSHTLSCRVTCVAERGALPRAAAAFPQQRTVGIEPLPIGVEIRRHSPVTRVTCIGIGIW